MDNLNDITNVGIWRFNAEPIKLKPPKPGIRYYKTKGRQRLKGEYIKVNTGVRGLTHWEYIAPLTVKQINYPEGWNQP